MKPKLAKPLPGFQKAGWRAGLAFVTAMTFGTIWYHDVSMVLTDADAEYARRYLEGVTTPSGAADSWKYEDQLGVIRATQAHVLAHNPIGAGIPKGREREPKDLFNYASGGLCYDRSNVLAKIFRHLGFDTRNAALYFTPNNVVLALLKPGIPSHAVTEVRTRNGWLLVDSNYPWVGVDNDGMPLSSIDIANLGEQAVSTLKEPLPASYRSPTMMHVVYGLRSRHGKFYPPFTPIPDYSLEELIHNFSP